MVSSLDGSGTFKKPGARFRAYWDARYLHFLPHWNTVEAFVITRLRSLPHAHCLTLGFTCPDCILLRFQVQSTSMWRIEQKLVRYTGSAHTD